MSSLRELFDAEGLSPWLDNLKRPYLTGGRLAELVGDGVRGLTSNPTIMAKAIEGGDAYDEQFRQCMARGDDAEAAYWDLVVADVVGALEVFSPLHQRSDGTDGFVSIEVAPDLARSTGRTVESARSLHDRIQRPNLLVKIPATAEGVPAIRQMISEGRSINVTLIFSIERYEEVMEAYLSGLETFVEGGGDPSKVASVASFFVSRVDTEVDRRLEAVAAASPERGERAHRLLGTIAVSQARLAYSHFEARFSGPRWESLAAAGARVQRPLWASTSTKNPHYADLLYVESLIGRNCVNTMPEDTIEKFIDHGRIERTIGRDLSGATAGLADLADLGVDLADVAATLEDEGVAAFEKSFAEVLDRLRDKAVSLGSER
ncbi:MAG: transaldolase [Acidimicrobiales bacterium]